MSIHIYKDADNRSLLGGCDVCDGKNKRLASFSFRGEGKGVVVGKQ